MFAEKNNETRKAPPCLFDYEGIDSRRNARPESVMMPRPRPCVRRRSGRRFGLKDAAWLCYALYTSQFLKFDNRKYVLCLNAALKIKTSCLPVLPRVMLSHYYFLTVMTCNSGGDVIQRDGCRVEIFSICYSHYRILLSQIWQRSSPHLL